MSLIVLANKINKNFYSNKIENKNIKNITLNIMVLSNCKRHIKFNTNKRIKLEGTPRSSIPHQSAGDILCNSDKINENRFIKILLKVLPYSINLEDAEEFYNRELPFLKSINTIFKNSKFPLSYKKIILSSDDIIFNKLLIDIAKNGFDNDEYSIFTKLLDDTVYNNLLDKIFNS